MTSACWEGKPPESQGEVRRLRLIQDGRWRGLAAYGIQQHPGVEGRDRAGLPRRSPPRPHPQRRAAAPEPAGVTSSESGSAARWVRRRPPDPPSRSSADILLSSAWKCNLNSPLGPADTSLPDALPQPEPGLWEVTGWGQEPGAGGWAAASWACLSQKGLEGAGLELLPSASRRPRSQDGPTDACGSADGRGLYLFPIPNAPFSLDLG